jgi:PadR family transcriptional regulator PadR
MKQTISPHGTLELLVLKSLEGGGLNGSQVAQRIREGTGGQVSVGPGSLYPTVHRLFERDCLKMTRGRSAKNRKAIIYELKRKGSARLIELSQQWRRFSPAVTRMVGNATTNDQSGPRREST